MIWFRKRIYYIFCWHKTSGTDITDLGWRNNFFFSLFLIMKKVIKLTSFQLKEIFWLGMNLISSSQNYIVVDVMRGYVLRFWRFMFLTLFWEWIPRSLALDRIWTRKVWLGFHFWIFVIVRTCRTTCDATGWGTAQFTSTVPRWISEKLRYMKINHKKT